MPTFATSKAAPSKLGAIAGVQIQLQAPAPTRGKLCDQTSRQPEGAEVSVPTATDWSSSEADANLAFHFVPVGAKCPT